MSTAGAGEPPSELYLLQVAQHIGPTVEHTPAFRGIQVVQELCSVVFVAFLVPMEAHKVIETASCPGPPGQAQVEQDRREGQSLCPPRPAPAAVSPEHQAPLDVCLHLLRHMLHISLRRRRGELRGGKENRAGGTQQPRWEGEARMLRHSLLSIMQGLPSASECLRRGLVRCSGGCRAQGWGQAHL